MVELQRFGPKITLAPLILRPPPRIFSNMGNDIFLNFIILEGEFILIVILTA